MENSDLHSAEYFGEQRDFWWNRDFLELMARRWKLADKREVLDVGCGIGHWTRCLNPWLPADARITGVDREAEWVRQARVSAPQGTQTFRFVEGDANALPFPDDSFDLVTSQTVLIHMRDPQATLHEWSRVLKPGGLLAVAEPNNLVGHAVNSNLDFFGPIEERVEHLRFVMMCERGKWNLGEGHNSIGDLIPGYCAAAGLQNVQVFVSDKVSSLIPPYSTYEEQVLLKQSKDWDEREIGIWNHRDTLRYFLAGGGNEDAFPVHWARALEARRKTAAALGRGDYHHPGAGMVYLISGTKPQ